MRVGEKIKRGSRLNFFWTFFLLLIASCGGGGGGGETVTADPVTISGVVSFESVTPKTSGLDYANSVNLPIRYVAVEAVTAIGSSLLASTVTDGSGNYSLTVPGNTSVKIRVKAKTISTTLPSWDIEIVDNTASKALYLLSSATFSSGSASTMTKDLVALSGWNGSSYSGVRASAPFAILDTMYKAVEMVRSVDPTVVIPKLVVNWSVNNIAASGDKTIGQIGTSHFTSAENQLYILGHAGSDTDEFDSHVIAHEWGHFFEHNLSRSDSTGGSHGSGNRLDPRLAFGEGFGNAISGMVLNDPVYLDTMGSAQNVVGVSFDLENNDYDTTSVGWYSEASVQSILYDIFDTASDGPDSVSLGFGPIYAVLVDDVPQQKSFVTLYSFIDSLKAQAPGSVVGINALLAYETISTTFVDEWDSTHTETNFSPSPVAPAHVYTELTVGGAAARLCSNAPYGRYNTIFNSRFFYFTLPSTGSYTVTATPVSASGDAIFSIYKSGAIIADDVDDYWYAPESFTSTLTAGVYVGKVSEYRYLYDNGGPTDSAECFDLTLQ